MPNGQFSVFKNFKSRLLEKRGLQRPDSRPLYEYRLSTDEVDELENLLRTWLGRIIGVYDLGDILKLTGFPALFVLYASEWWRRRYDGSGFSWEPILRDLGVESDSWTPNERSQCVKAGLAEWGLKPRSSGALRFLGTIAIQGGLPLQLLSQARGGVGNLLRQVLKLAEGRQVSKTEVRGWIESLRKRLPKSYRQEIIYALLTDMVTTVLELKHEAGLSIGVDAVAVLDERIPDWKQRFPLSLDDAHAESLVEQLVKDAANIQIRKVKPDLPVERFLEKDEQGLWHLVSRIELPITLEDKLLSRLFGMDAADQPRTATLELQAGNQVLQTRIRKLAGHNSYRLETVEWQFEDEAACEEHVFQLSAPDGRTWMAEAHKGESLDSDLPWIFEKDVPNRFLKQGAGRVAPAKVLLALPEGWRIQHDDEKENKPVGDLRYPARSLYCGEERVHLQASHGGRSVVITGQATAIEQQFIWTGNRLWLDFISPRQAYKGMPQLYKVDDEGGRQRIEGRPGCSVIGAPGSHHCTGPVNLRYPPTGDHQIQTRMLLLPKQAEIKLEAADAKSGQIHFSDWGLTGAVVLDRPEVKQKVHQEGDETILQVVVDEGSRTPEWLQIELHWPDTTKSAQIRLPYPAGGARVFDAKNRELHSGDQLSIQDLMGVRLVVNLAGSLSRRIELNIASGHLARSHPLRALPGALKLEVSLVEYLTDIHHLLSMDDSPDSRVTVSLWTNGQSIFDMKIARYAAVMEWDADRVYLENTDMANLDADILGQIAVLAARLEYPSDEPIKLEPILSEGVPAGSWRFEPQNKDPGTWLIYPAPDSPVMFRACVWPVEGEIQADDRLIQDLSINEQDLREYSIKQTISMMSEDYSHPSWRIVEQLASQYGHLPLATLDLWRMFAHSQEGMATLAFRLSDLPRNFHLRFAHELPFTWEIVSLKAWREAIGQLKKQCLDQYGKEPGAQIFCGHLESVSQVLGAESGALQYALGITSANFDEQARRNHDLLREHVAPHAVEDLFGGPDSKLMNLRRRHAEDDNWPTNFSQLLRQARTDVDIQPFLNLDSFDFQDGVINMPLIVAAAVAHDKTEEYFSDPENIHLLRTFRAFDMDWFDEAYNLTILRCLAETGCEA
jgi:hypothetical protein